MSLSLDTMNNRVDPSTKSPPDDIPVTRSTVGVVVPTSGGAPADDVASSTVVREGATDGGHDVGTIVLSTPNAASQIAVAGAAALAAIPPAGATIDCPPAGSIVAANATTTRKHKKKATSGKPK